MALNAELPNSFKKKKNPVTHSSFPFARMPWGLRGRTKDELCNGCVWERGEGKEERKREDRRAQKKMGRKREGTKEMDGGGREEQRI